MVAALIKYNILLSSVITEDLVNSQNSIILHLDILVTLRKIWVHELWNKNMYT